MASNVLIEDDLKLEKELYARFEEKLETSGIQPGALIPLLQTAQNLFGYLPERALKSISLVTGKSYSEVTGVASFYSYFSFVPRGKHIIRVCQGTACYVRGGKQVLANIKACLGIEAGETTRDKMFSLEIGRCFGACGLAPVIMVDDETYPRVSPSGVKEILNRYYDRETK